MESITTDEKEMGCLREDSDIALEKHGTKEVKAGGSL